MTVKLPDGREGDAGKCRSCGAEVAFVYNPKSGKTPPFNLTEVVIEDKTYPAGASHFATCQVWYAGSCPCCGRAFTKIGDLWIYEQDLPYNGPLERYTIRKRWFFKCVECEAKP
jgi:hypothetical protein